MPSSSLHMNAMLSVYISQHSLLQASCLHVQGVLRSCHPGDVAFPPAGLSEACPGAAPPLSGQLQLKVLLEFIVVMFL